MSIRRDSIYVSTDVWRACLMLAKAQDLERETTSRQLLTADEIADSLLRKTITEKYPELFEHQKTIDKLEKELIKTLGEPK